LQPAGASVAADGLCDAHILRQLLLDEFFDAQPVALQEGRPKGLAVVGEDDQVVGARRLFLDHAPQAGKGAVQTLEVAKGVVRPGAGVVRHLIVAEIEHVDRGRPAQHVEDGDVGGDVAHQRTHSGAQKRVAVLQTVEARLHILAFLLPGLPQFASDFPEEDDQGAGEEVGIEHQQLHILGAALLLLRAAGAHVCHREHRLLSVAAEHVHDAGAVTHQPLAVGVAGVQFRRVARRNIELALCLVIPAIGGDVVVVAEHDAGLAGRCHRGQAAVRPVQLIAILVDHLLQRGQQTVGQRLLQMPVAQAVDLYHHQPASRLVGAGKALLTGATLDAPLVKGTFFVQLQHAGKDGVEDGKDDATQQPAEQTHVKAGQQPRRNPEGDGVDQEADDEQCDPAQRPGDQQDDGTDEQVDDRQQQRGGDGNQPGRCFINRRQRHAGQQPGGANNGERIHHP